MLGDFKMEQVQIKPRIMPRDFIDYLILFGLGMLVILLHIALDSQGYPIFDAPGPGDSALGLYIFLGLYALLLALLLLNTVWSITISDDGIKLNRIIGTPKFLKWGEIKEIRKATRKEVMRDAWFTFSMLRRDASASTSSLHHYRISWGAEYYFYPPRDLNVFEKAVASRLKDPVQKKGESV